MGVLVFTSFAILCLVPASYASHNAVIRVTDDDVSSEESLFALYKRWLAIHHPHVNDSGSGGLDWGGDYLTSKRFDAFKRNAQYIHASNKRSNVTYTLGLNKFADLSNEEFQAMYTQWPRTAIRQQGEGGRASFVYEKGSETLPAVVDWRKKGAVTAVKDQGPCGM